MESTFAVDATIIVAVIALIQAIGVAAINGILNRKERNNDEYRQKREKLEKEEQQKQQERDDYRRDLDIALLGLSFSTANGTEVLLHRAHGDKLNGDVDHALDEIRDAKEKCNDIINKKAMS